MAVQINPRSQFTQTERNHLWRSITGEVPAINPSQEDMQILSDSSNTPPSAQATYDFEPSKERTLFTRLSLENHRLHLHLLSRRKVGGLGR